MNLNFLAPAPSARNNCKSPLQLVPHSHDQPSSILPDRKISASSEGREERRFFRGGCLSKGFFRERPPHFGERMADSPHSEPNLWGIVLTGGESMCFFYNYKMFYAKSAIHCIKGA